MASVAAPSFASATKTLVTGLDLLEKIALVVEDEEEEDVVLVSLPFPDPLESW